jgi:DNA uptake protein ComE-like DNA-binding protein
LAEAQQLSTGKNWEKFTLLDVSRMADHFASEALGLALLGHYKAGEFNEKDGAFESLHKGDTGVWEFTKVASGTYLLSILSDKLAAEGEEIKVAYKTDDKEEFKDFSSLLFTQGSAFYGRIELKEENLTLQLKIINDSEERLVLKQIQLEPIDSVRGRININTASPEALRSILISDELTQTILNNRPIGVKDNRNLGIGELFLLDPRFLNLHNYLTVKSDVYEINCRGEYYLQGKTLAYQTIRTVLERGE